MSDVKATVLLVDDNYHIRMPIRVYLERRGYRVLEASDGLEAMEQAVAHHPDVIVLDVMMPVVGGHEALKRLKKNDVTKNIPVLMLTAVNEKNSVFSSLAGGAGDYVIKGSVGIAEIHQRIERLLEKKTSGALNAASSPDRIVAEEEIRNAIRDLSQRAAMPGRLADVITLINRPGCTVRDWTDLLQAQQGLAETIAVLAGLGSADAAGKLDAPALGTSRLRHLALAAGVVTAFSAFSNSLLQRHMLGAALMTRSLAMQTQCASPDEAMTAGLFHDFGKFLLSNRFPGQYNTVLRRAQEEHKPVLELERRFLGIDHTAFAAEIMRGWGVSPEVIEVVRLHHTPYNKIIERASFNPALVAAVQVADAMDCIWDSDGADGCLETFVDEAALALHLDQKSLNAALDSALALIGKMLSGGKEIHGKQLKPDDASKNANRKKILLVHANSTGVLMLENLFLKCSLNAKPAAFENLQNRDLGCDIIFARITDKAQVEPLLALCAKVRETSKTKPICILVDSQPAIEAAFPGADIFKDYISESVLNEIIKSRTAPARSDSAASAVKAQDAGTDA
jgi:putative nucleotidyltransferase with HDIG domain